MTPRKWYQPIAATIIIAGCLYSPLGWCQPPVGPLLPRLGTYYFARVPLGQTGFLTISYSLDPNYSLAPGPWVVSDMPYLFALTQGGAFSVDVSQTSCVPGTAITTTVGCNVTLAFSPTALGTSFVQFFELNLCQGTSSSCDPPIPGSALTLVAVGVAPLVPVPLLSRSGLVALILLFAGAAPLAWSFRKRAP